MKDTAVPDAPHDWRAEIATQVCKLVRDDRAMARFRTMCAAFCAERKQDEEQRAEWEHHRKVHCERGLRTLAQINARWIRTEQLGEDRKKIERTRPKEDTQKTWVFDYYVGTHSSGSVIQLQVWVPPELRLAASPKLTVPPLFGRFTGRLHEPKFGTSIEPVIASLSEKYASLAALHDAYFPDRELIHEMKYVNGGLLTEGFGRRPPREALKEAVVALPNTVEVNVLAWLADVEANLVANLEPLDQLKRPNSKPSDASTSEECQGLVATLKIGPLGTLGEKTMPTHQASLSIDLKEILRRVFKTKQGRDTLVMDRAFAIALRLPEKELEPSERVLLEGVIKGLVDVQFTVSFSGTIRYTLNDERFKSLVLPRHIFLATSEIREEELRRLRIHSGKMNAWEFVVDRLGAAIAHRKRSLNGYSDRHYDEYSIGGYCWRLISGTTNQPDEFEEHINALQREGYAEELTTQLWENCPCEAREMTLPKASASLPHEAALEGERSEPMTRAEIARRIFDGKKDRARDVAPLLKQYRAEPVAGTRMVRVRLDLMDQFTRRKIEKPSRSS